MKTLSYLATLLSLTVLNAAGNGWAMSEQEYSELQTANFKGKPPEYIARFFSHPNGSVSNAAIQAMTEEYGEAAMPLLAKLVKDKHPFIRRGAVRVMTEIYLPKRKKGEKKPDAPPEVTPAMEKMLALVEPLTGDPHPVVSQAVAELNVELGVDTPATRKMALFMAGNSDKEVRRRAIEIGTKIIRDPETQVKIGMTVSGFPDNVARTWGYAHGMIAKHKKDPICRQAIPALAIYQLDVGNAQPVRGMFSDSPQSRALETIKAQWDGEVEKMPKVVPAICRTYVRVPGGWMSTRSLALDILKMMSPSAAPAVRAAAEEEKKWLAAASDVELLLFGNRETFAKAVDYLDYIAGCLESGDPITRKSPIAIEEEKLYEDKIPEPGALDLDIDLE